MEDCIEKRTESLATKEDLFLVEQKLSAEVSSLKELMHANTWKILSGMVAIFGIFRFVDMLLGK